MANTLADAPTSATTIGDTDLMHIKVGTGANSDKKITGADVKAMFATAAQGGTADTAVQPGDDANTLGSGEATDGYVLTADGAGNATWEAPAGGGISEVSEDTSPTLGGDLSLGGFKLLSGASSDAVIKLGDNAGARKLSITDSDDAEVAYINSDGAFGTGVGTFTSGVANGASAVGFSFNTSNAFSTAGAKLASWKNNGTEVLGLGLDDAAGLILGPDATNPTAKIYRTAVYGQIELARKGVAQKGYVRGSNSAIDIGHTSTSGGGAPVISLTPAAIVLGQDSINSLVTLGIANDTIQRTNRLQADYNTARDRDGSHLEIYGGNGGATDRSGGNVVLGGGSATGTGHKGYIILDLSSLPTSDPSVNGALWLNSGTLTVSGA